MRVGVPPGAGRGDLGAFGSRYIVGMTAHAKLLDRILRGRSDKNIEFDSLCALLKRLGFRERVRGDHHIFSKDGVAEILNLQLANTKQRRTK